MSSDGGHRTAAAFALSARLDRVRRGRVPRRRGRWARHASATRAFLDGAVAEVRRRGAILQFSSLSMTRALIQYTRGALLEAEADGRAALEAMPHNPVWFVPHAHGWLTQILVERGAVDEAAELIGRVPEPPDPFSRTPVHRARALVASARGEHRVALDQALRL